MKTHLAIAMPVFAAMLFAAPSAHAQNADQFFFGDEAALGAGAVVASGRDSGALWYNPAGFGGLQRGMVSASASTFGLRIRKIPAAIRVRVGGQESSSDLALRATPTRPRLVRHVRQDQPERSVLVVRGELGPESDRRA